MDIESKSVGTSWERSNIRQGKKEILYIHTYIYTHTYIYVYVCVYIYICKSTDFVFSSLQLQNLEQFCVNRRHIMFVD